jgi:hypothetical protein
VGEEIIDSVSTQCASKKSPRCEEIFLDIRFEVFTAVTVKNGVFWDVMLCGSCKNRCYVGSEPHGVTLQKTPFFNFLYP